METMTQEEKELLIKDLCARLPYGVKVKLGDNPNIFDLEYRIKFAIMYGDSDKLEDILDITNIKPYLFPLSSMTDEQRKELEELYLGYYVTCQDIDDDGYIWDENVFEIIPCTETDDWCNKNHFDHRSLIPKGLALDATGKNVY